MAAIRLVAHSPAEPGWRDRLKVHLLGLGPDSRVNRFFAWVSDAQVERYAATAAPEIVIDALEDGAVIGVAEVYRRPDMAGAAEIALSVDEGHRHAGIGQALVDRALDEGRRRGFADLFFFFRKSNRAMQRIADHAGMEPVASGDPGIAEVHARLRGQVDRLALVAPGRVIAL
ncbi:GNAT family N-acetyltransferase [Albidovulum sediminis]|uniref:GNAT family N-acetyltransferase n=1 Tax=Albidovulum sediminis TaxID=3066345 RepID=A0ABT2NLD2_9RHOB|nr:GNAT family N-acetyltransferase [Defluviimonas sediminis]MCT8329723.1 GNAT family N-acetyltransferase [Defluviimonas sediminis]